MAIRVVIEVMGIGFIDNPVVSLSDKDVELFISRVQAIGLGFFMSFMKAKTVTTLLKSCKLTSIYTQATSYKSFQESAYER